MSFKKCINDLCLYSRFAKGNITYLLVYIDDLIITSNNSKEISEIQGLLSSNFDMSKISNLGDSSFLALKINLNRRNSYINISQKQYIKNLLTVFYMSECNGISTPMEANLKITKSSKLINVPYRELVGSLLYVARGNRPDISFSVNYLSRYQNEYSHLNRNIS